MQVTVTNAQVQIGKQHVLAELSATFPTRTVSCVVGPSGSGKSTLLAAIAGHQRLTGGTISYDEKIIPPSAVHALYSWVAQTPNLLPARTVLDNVLLGPLSKGRSAKRAIALAQRALQRVGLDHKTSTTSRNLSGGEAQRVAIARALASERPIILADEPSAGLDATNTEQLAQIFYRLAATTTIIVATHDPMLMNATEHVVQLR